MKCERTNSGGLVWVTKSPVNAKESGVTSSRVRTEAPLAPTQCSGSYQPQGNTTDCSHTQGLCVGHRNEFIPYSKDFICSL